MSTRYFGSKGVTNTKVTSSYYSPITTRKCVVYCFCRGKCLNRAYLSFTVSVSYALVTMDKQTVVIPNEEFIKRREENEAENQLFRSQKVQRRHVEVHKELKDRSPDSCTLQTFSFIYSGESKSDEEIGTPNSSFKTEGFSKVIPEKDRPQSESAVEVEISFNETDTPIVVESLYWRNFLTILEDIQSNENLRDYFLPEERATFDHFSTLSTEAQKLYVRLINRKHNWHRVTSLKYQEITHELEPVVNDLIEKQFLTSDVDAEEIHAILDLLALPELKTLCKHFRLKTEGKKENLVRALIDFSRKQKQLFAGFSKDIKTVMKEKAVKTLGKMVKLRREPRQLFLRTMLLYSLPLARDMDMEGKIPLLNTMGRVHAKLVIYPDYPFRTLQKIFTSRDALVRYQNALELEATIKGKVLNKNIDEVVDLFDAVISRFKELGENEMIREEDENLPLFLRSYTAGSVLAKAVYYCIECLRMRKLYSKMVSAYHTLLSQKIYLVHYHGRWYDQLALIYHHHLKNVPKAIDILLEAMSAPSLSDIDRILLSNRSSLILNFKHKDKGDSEKVSVLENMIFSLKNPPEISIQARCLNSKIGAGIKMSYVHETEEGVEQMLSSVEETVIIHHKKLGFDQGIHAENATSHSLFGIFFWDIIYTTEVQNVFVCHYQTHPLDLRSGEFFMNRKSAVEQRVRDIEKGWSDDQLHSHMERIWTEERGKESLVSWRTFEELDLLKNLIGCIGRRVISKICKRMAEEYPLAQKGFPDIIIWNEGTKKCKFIEVKGPGDRLSPSQRSWLDFLISAGADASVCHVKTIGAKFLKRKLDADDVEPMNMEESITLD